MQLDGYIKLLQDNGVKYQTNVALSKYGCYGVGGPCDIMAFPKDKKQLEICATEKCEVIGNGTNILFSDKGYRGIIINTKNLNKVVVKGVTIIAESGASLQSVNNYAELNCLTGLEFTEGIPASVGGAVCMNAGCFCKSVGDKVAYVITDKGIFNNENCKFAYRNSVFSELIDEKKHIIYSVCFLLKPGEYDVMQEKKEKYKKLRKGSQPKGKSCGSVFLNDGYFAGKIIDSCHLKGYNIGGAFVSDIHANFIINKNGSAQDIYDLIKYVKNVVYKTQDIKLKEEIKYVGEFND